MSIRDSEEEVSIFKDEDDNFYSLAPDGKLLGPYTTPEVAEAKYHEYCAYTVDAPACHHPHN